MRNAGKIAVLCVAAFSLLIASGCKKKFDPNDFEAGAGASASAAASTTAPAIDSSGVATTDDDAGDGLAPLVTGKQHVAVAAGGGGGGAAKPKGDPPECVQARQFCNQQTRSGDRRKAAENEKNCNDFRFACFNKGGHL